MGATTQKIFTPKLQELQHFATEISNEAQTPLLRVGAVMPSLRVASRGFA